jgi:hypothetical protein
MTQKYMEWTVIIVTWSQELLNILQSINNDLTSLTGLWQGLPYFRNIITIQWSVNASHVELHNDTLC